MAVTASGLFGLSLEKALIDTLGESWEAEDNKVLVADDSITPAFDTWDFRNDVPELTGSGWASGGVALTGTELTISPAGTLMFDATDISQPNVTLVAAMCSVHYTNVGAAGTDQLVQLHDFVSAVSPSNGTFTIQWHATNGLTLIDYTP
jgi:hypothetical protein